MHGITKWAAGIALWCIAAAASATSVTYDLTNVSGSTWQYDFTIVNDSVGVAIPEFTLFFDYATFGNLAEVSEPAQFAGPLVVQPTVPSDPSAPFAVDGFFDYLAVDAGLLPGATLGGFVVTVDFSGAGTPGGPTFQTLDANFNTLDTGSASATVAPGVPEPTTLGLLGLGLIGGYFARRRTLRS